MLKLTNIQKSFSGVKALKKVNLDIRAGEIHALLGENGAGKSTLMKVISGAHLADDGDIVFEDEIITINSPSIAQALGIRIIYQEFSLVPSLTVTENIYLGQHKGTSWMQWKSLNRAAQELIHSLGFSLDVHKEVAQLSVAEQQVVEIAKALSSDVKLLILDEPSAVLGTAEVHKLFTLLRNLRDRGVAIIYISHHLEELLELTDRITVLKDGASIDTVQTAHVDKDKLVALMVGRELSTMYPKKNQSQGFDGKIAVKNLITPISNKPLSFDIYQGEILGIGGLVGSGRTEILNSLFGKLGSAAAQVQYNTESISLRSPKDIINQGWGMVPEDRKQYGGILSLSIKENISLANLNKVANRWGFINHSKEKDIVNSLIAQLQVKIGHIEDPLFSLSGGNQQKIILAKWLNLDLKVLLIDEPTRGVDVGARAEIYQIIQNLANKGVFVLMVSSDVEELMGMSDRILVIREGEVQGELYRENFSEETILRMAIGVNQ